jgi:hypothetical protein
MHALCRYFYRIALCRHCRIAHDVVEGDDARGARCLPDDALAFRVIDGRDFLLVVKVLYRRLVVQQDKAFSIQRELADQRPRIADRHLMRFAFAGSGRHPRRRLVIVGDGLFRHWNEEVERRHDPL